MAAPKGRSKVQKVLSSSKLLPAMSNQKEDRYAFKNAGPGVSQKGPRLVGKTIYNLPLQSSVPMNSRGQQAIETNVASSRRGVATEASVSDITSAADQFNNYRFNEAAATKIY